jgi:hypothetical protein
MWARVVAVTCCALMVATTVSSTADAAPRQCNGSAALCDRSVGDVAFATAHNAMSSVTDRFKGPNQDHPIARQLAFGIRGFQIDAFPGVRRRVGVQTDTSALVGKVTRDMSPDLVAVGEALHRRLGRSTGSDQSELFLCHVFCELGAVSMIGELRTIRRFLQRHPNEVLMIVIEDHVAADRIRGEFTRAGLADMMLAVAPAEPLPTLGEMLADGKRLVVMLENGDGGPTLPNGFADLLQETPFKFRNVDQLRQPSSCRPNRGIPDGPVFQLNHWVTPASRRGSEDANAMKELGRRARRCQEKRGARATLVAVDFAERGAVLRVVRELNRPG